jgi:chromosomal replication initiator protein
MEGRETSLETRLMHITKHDYDSYSGSYVWEKVMSLLLEKYGEPIYRSWLSHLKFQEMKQSELVLTVPSKFIREWIINNYLKSIKTLVSSIQPEINNVDIRVKPNRAKIAPKFVTNDNFFSVPTTSNEERCDVFSYTLDPRFTFNTYVTGASNKIAVAAAKALVESNSSVTDNNVLFIKSPVGMGKTHLMQAIAAQIKAKDPSKKVAYLSADKFIYLYIKSVKNNRLIEFKEKLRSADVLLFDDLQFICGKTGTQQEFLNTFSALTESNRKVVLTCDVSPYNLNLDKRSISKLAGGLVVGIKPSDRELRVKILEAKAHQYNIKIPAEVIELIADNIVTSNRELEGALNKLITHCSLGDSEITMKAAEEILKDNFHANDQTITVERIMQIVADHYNIKVEDLISKSRAARFVVPRQVSAYLSKQLTKNSLQDIGFKLGGRDHATVIYSVRKLEDRLVVDKKMVEDIAKLIEFIGKP